MLTRLNARSIVGLHECHNYGQDKNPFGDRSQAESHVTPTPVAKLHYLMIPVRRCFSPRTLTRSLYESGKTFCSDSPIAFSNRSRSSNTHLADRRTASFREIVGIGR